MPSLCIVNQLVTRFESTLQKRNSCKNPKPRLKAPEPETRRIVSLIATSTKPLFPHFRIRTRQKTSRTGTGWTDGRAGGTARMPLAADGNENDTIGLQG